MFSVSKINVRNFEPVFFVRSVSSVDDIAFAINFGRLPSIEGHLIEGTVRKLAEQKSLAPLKFLSCIVCIGTESRGGEKIR